MSIKKLLFIPLFMLIFSFGVSEAFDPQWKNSFELQDFAEQTLQLEKLELQERNPFPTLKVFLAQHCDDKALEEGEKLAKTLETPWTESLKTLNTQVQWEKLFSDTKQITLQLKKEKEKPFCSQKYLLYSLLDQTQNAFLDFQKKEKADSEEHAAAKEKEISPKKAQKADFSKNFKELTQKNLKAELKNLVQLKILSLKESKLIEEKTEISYYPGCEKAKGSFHLLQHQQSKDKQFKALKLSIGICQETNYLAKYRAYFKQIFAHELGHYLYFFKDRNPDAFNNICRKQRKKSCKYEEFVSSYAQQNQEEDYAESFAYWYKDKGKEKEFWSAPANETLWKKEKHFEEIFGKS